MLKERNREIPQSGAADEIHPETNAPRVLGEISGAADADALLADEDRRIAERQTQPVAEEAQRIAAVENLRKIGRAAWEQVLVATPNQRVADIIVKATEYLGVDATARQLAHVAGHIQGFARDATDLLTRGDFHGLDSAITRFWLGVRDADKLAPPKPRLMPSGDAFYYAGWSSEERQGLGNILGKRLCGLKAGDVCIAIDADGATLASGAHLSRKQALEAYILPAGGKMIAVGSLSRVLAVIEARR